MLRVNDEWLDCAIYLYSTVDDAQMGSRTGGSGFLVGALFDDEDPSVGLLFAVTAWHVASHAPIIRLNTWRGDTSIIDVASLDWIEHPDGDDLAICPVGLSQDYHRYTSVLSNQIATEDMIRDEDIGAGDECFSIGRFLTHDGFQLNAPVTRFGSISMMPTPIPSAERGPQLSYLVEVRSLPGCSGSGVWVYKKPMTIRPTRPQLATWGPYLLGIDWCHLRQYMPVYEADGRTKTDYIVHDNTGMMGVIPGWKLLEMLELPEVREMKRDAKERLDRARRESAVSLDVAEQPMTKDEFERALRKVSRRTTPSEPDQASSQT